MVRSQSTRGAEKRLRVSLLLPNFPIVSQTYMLNEIAAIPDRFELKLCSYRPPAIGCEEAPPYASAHDFDDALAWLRETNPDVVHTHFLKFAPMVARLCEATGLQFTVRAHSFDTLSTDALAIATETVQAINASTCLGVLVFPFAVPHLISLGITSSKLVVCPPVVDFFRFYNREMNDVGVINVGACLPKKKLDDYLWLAQHVDLPCSLYPIGYLTEQFAASNASAGFPVHVQPVVQPSQMPSVYKAHNWLVYTACFTTKTVGWPMAVAEAQAAGLGICVANIRSDLAEYVGPAGFLYDDISDVPAIVEAQYPSQMRQAGFEHARQWDIRDHIHRLTDLWDSRNGARRTTFKRAAARKARSPKSQ